MVFLAIFVFSRVSLFYVKKTTDILDTFGGLKFMYKGNLLLKTEYFTYFSEVKHIFCPSTDIRSEKSMYSDENFKV